MFLLSLLLTSIVVAANGQNLAVDISAGIVKGATCTFSNATSFLSVPFAQPPVGDLRFAAPQPYKKFPNGTYSATTPAPACIQFGSYFTETGPASEDCLYVNVWVPGNATAKSNLPVKVWVYGGGDYAGGISNPLYDGCDLATDAIVVSIAYRVGALGFLALHSANFTGNYGVQDLLLGLQWVQDNIAAFGGNPKEVVFFGQSAGAELTWIISTLPHAKSLMKAVIYESGPLRPLPTYDVYQASGANYASTLGCGATNISCFRSKSTAELNSSTLNLPPTVVTSNQKFQPYVDGKIVAVNPSSTHSKVPVLGGSTSIEGSSFALLQFGDPRTITATDYYNFLEANFNTTATLVNQTFPLSLFNSTPAPAFAAIATVLTDAGFKCPTHKALKASASAGIPTYTYLWSHTPSCGWQPGITTDLLPVFGATHTSELPFVFANVDRLPRPDGNCTLDEQEKQLSATLTDAWTSMASIGKPSHDEGTWPKFHLNKSLGLNFVNSSSVGVVDYTVCEFWDQLQY